MDEKILEVAYNPNFLLLGLLVVHMTNPFTYLETVSFIRGQ
jgi:hypothetical protein